MVLGVQLIGFIFAVFMAYYSFLHYKRGDFTIKEFSFWIVMWIMLIIISLFPGILDIFVKKLNFSRTFDLLVVVGLILLIAMFFYLYLLLRSNQRKLEQLVRNLAYKKLARNKQRRRLAFPQRTSCRL